ncbi:NAD(P)-dependent oxidoreductase [Candidatus Falkowbacteria bacterium]|nr:NAD(P)-dependent oxidoreductase [Candidatus Falkowbacteria bacterium]
MLNQIFKNKTVSITGATGFVGKHLTELLIDAGTNVEILTRQSMSSLPSNWQTRTTIVHGDLFSLNNFGQNSDYVFHLAVENFNKKLMTQINVIGTKKIVERLKDSAKIKKFIFLSSICVFGNRHKEKVISEEAICLPRNQYEKTKYEAEIFIRNQISLGFPAVIIRPSIIYGPGAKENNNFFRIVKAIKRGYFCFVGEQKSFYNIIYIHDVIRALLALAQTENSENNKIFSINEPIEWREFCVLVQKQLGLSNKIHTIPKAIAWPLSIVGSGFRYLKLPSPITYVAYKILTCPSVYGTKNAEFQLSGIEKIGHERGIAETINYMKSAGII